MQEQLNYAKKLMQEKRFAEARKIIVSVDHPKRDEWLAQVDNVERRYLTSLTETAPPTPTPITPPLSEERRAKFVYKPDSNSASRKSVLTLNIPLPLFPEEERKLTPHGMPVHPAIIAKRRAGIRVGNTIFVGGRTWLIATFWGFKTVGFVINYFKMRQYALSAFFLLMYIFLVPASITSFYLLASIYSQYSDTGILDIMNLLIALLFFIVLPFFPYIVGWVQTAHYEEWARKYSIAYQRHLNQGVNTQR